MVTKVKSQKSLSKAQKRVLEALSLNGSRLVPATDFPGQRVGYVTTNGCLTGYVCAVSLRTQEVLVDAGLIVNDKGWYYKAPQSD